MSAASNVATSLLGESPQDNLWRGSATSSSPRSSAAASSSTRKIKRKPAPQIPAELLKQQDPSGATSTSPTPVRPVLVEKSLNETQDAGPSTVSEASSSTAHPVASTQRPQRQYLLDIDAPTASSSTSGTQDDSVKQLLRPASVSPASASTRPWKGPLRWMQDKEEHTATASSSAPPLARQTTLSRKTSILKMSLRRNRFEEQPSSIMEISGPTDFVHVSMGAEEANTRSAVAPLRRPTWTSNRSSVRSSTSSTLSGLSYDTANSSTIDAEVGEDKVLYTNGERKHPLRPLKSIRRPSKLTLNKEEPAWSGASGSTSPKDKRKALYVTPGDVPSILEPMAELPPTNAGEQFAGALGRNISRNRGRGSESSETAPELVVSGSPSSGYESSGASNRSSLASLQEFRSFLDLGGEERKEGEDLWARTGLGVPIVLDKF